jgi:hypothetical protein
MTVKRFPFVPRTWTNYQNLHLKSHLAHHRAMSRAQKYVVGPLWFVKLPRKCTGKMDEVEANNHVL